MPCAALSNLDDILLSRLADEQGSRDDADEANRAIADSIRRSLTPKQLAVVEDEWSWKSAICPRRAGKSYCAMSYAYDVCLRRPNAMVVIVTLTLKSAKVIYWYEMKKFARRLGIEVEFYKNELLISLSNGSMVMLIGAESKEQIDKLRGGQYDLVIIDEAKSYPPAVINELIDDVVDPALMDREGTLLMIGTPGNILGGEFFNATYPAAKDKEGRPYSRYFDEPETYWQENPDEEWRWSRHSWTLQDNIHMPHAWGRALRKKKQNNWKDDHPTWQREYLGVWVASDSSFVYAYAHLVHTDPDLVTWEPDFHKGDGGPLGLPHKGPWHFVMGLDMGFVDDFAIVICAYSPHDTTLYQVYDFRKSHQTVDEIAEHVMEAKDAVGGEVTAIVADVGGLGKTIVETLNKRYGWNIQAAEKREKFDHIEILNSDFHAGRCKLLKESDTSVELQALQWDTTKASKEHLARTGKLKEHDKLPNHLADALLYLWRFAYNFWAEDRPYTATPGTREWESAQEAKVVEMMVQQREDRLNRSFFDQLSAESVDPLEGFYVN